MSRIFNYALSRIFDQLIQARCEWESYGYYDQLVIDNGSLQRFHEFVDTWTRIQQNFKLIAQDLDDG